MSPNSSIGFFAELLTKLDVAYHWSPDHFMLAIVLPEQALRIAVSQIKPLEVAAPPPGAIGSYILLPIALIALLLSLRESSKAD